MGVGFRPAQFSEPSVPNDPPSCGSSPTGHKVTILNKYVQTT